MASLALLRVPEGLEMQAVVLCTSTTRPENLEPGAMISETDTGNVRVNNGTYNAPDWSSPINSASVDASSAVKGQTLLSVDPAVPTAPIAVGENDPDYTDAVAHKDATGNPHGAVAGDVGAAPSSHVNSTNGHPAATTTDAGFMSAADKQKVHDRAHAIASETDHSDIDNANKADGRVLVWRDASSAHVYEDPAAASVDPASETVQGKVELATAAETDTGTDNARAVHPAGLYPLVPAGRMEPYAGFDAPSGWLLCNGAAVSRATYSRLFGVMTKTTTGTTVTGSSAVTVTSSSGMVAGMPVEGPGIALGATVLSVINATQITLSEEAGAGSGAGTIRVLPFGKGDGSTTFNVPDSRGRTLIGAGQGSALTNRRLGATTGQESVSLSVAEMPTHSHTTGFNTNNNTTQTGGGVRLAGSGTDVNIGTSSAGGGGAHENMQPSLAVNYIVKT
jgi:microcystin-dependent protein